MTGVNVIGMPFGMHGLGLELRDKVLAMRAAGVDVCILEKNYSSLKRELRDPRIEDLVVDAPRYDTNLICHNLPATALLARKEPNLLEGRYNIGAPYWEFPQLPDSHRRGLEHLDEIWVCTDFLKDSFAPHTDCPIHKMPIHVAPVKRATPRAPAVSDDGAIVFGYVFDFNSMAARKDPLLLILAFLERFADKPRANVRLVLKYKVERSHLVRQRDVDDLVAMAAIDPRIELISAPLSAADMDALYDRFDVYVSPHRAEGLGRGIVETMMKGGAVAATAYSGPAEYLQPGCARALDCAVTHVGAAAMGDIKSHFTWADVRLESVMDALGAFADDPASCAVYGRNAQRLMAADHGPEKHGAACLKRLGRIENERK